MLVKQILSSFKNNFRSFSVSKFGVVGAGQMGTGIAIVASRNAKVHVLIMDPFPAQLEKSKTFLQNFVANNVKKGKIKAEEGEALISRIAYHSTLDAMKEADFVIEAANEDFNIKKKIFQDLCRVTKPSTILATNTSSISITKIAAITDRPHKFVGQHWMNPVPIMKGVEIISGLATSKETTDEAINFARLCGKKTCTSLDMPGFIVNRVLMPYINEAIYALQDGLASKEDIDLGMVLGTNVPMGPLTLADFIGLDTCLAIMRVLHTELGDSKYRPCPLLVKYVDAGWHGRKNKKGFYTYK